jgi:sec-independent protein translocase protein TatB
MFDIAPTELLIVALVALVVIGPKDLPRVMRTVGQWVGRARGMARHFRSGIDTMIRESELEEMEKRWREENERIMQAHPMAAPSQSEGSDPPDFDDPAMQPPSQPDEERPAQ